MISGNNRSRLEAAGLIRQGYTFTPEDDETLESLTTDEVDALIAIGQKLGTDFLNRNSGGDTHGILF
jgi:hypothetical protein